MRDKIQAFIDDPENAKNQAGLMEAINELRVQVIAKLNALGEEGGDKMLDVTQEILNELNLDLYRKPIDTVLQEIGTLSDQQSKISVSKRAAGESDEDYITRQQTAAGNLGMLAQLAGYIEQNRPADRCTIM